MVKSNGMKYIIYLIATLSSVFSVNSTGQTLSDALNKKDMALAEQLIKKGADPNAVDANGNSLLSTACRWGYADQVQFLLSHGASVDKPRSPGGRTALIVACAYYAKTDVVKTLLDKGADVNAADNKGVTALMMASEFQKADIVKLLLAAGANVKLKDKTGKTALDYLNMNVVDDDLKQMLKGFTIDKDAVTKMLHNSIK